jgi:hypothetical protein
MHRDRSTLQHTCVQVFAKLDELKEMRQFVPEGWSCPPHLHGWLRSNRIAGHTT